jgi:hypothetical protein
MVIELKWLRFLKEANPRVKTDDVLALGFIAVFMGEP